MNIVPKPLRELSVSAMEIYNFIGFYKKSKGKFPTQTDISEGLGKSRQLVHILINKQLITRGLVEMVQKKETQTKVYKMKREYKINIKRIAVK